MMLSELKRESDRTFTENGALSNRSAGGSCLDFFAVCGALRNEERSVPIRLFIRAYAENRDLAMRALFYARDIRGGLGERELFRGILSWLANNRPQSVIGNLRFIAEYGRWDDVLSLLDTQCGHAALQCIRTQWQKDLQAMECGEPVSLLAKWLPSVNTSSKSRKQQARHLCRRMKMTEKEYRHALSRLRTRIDVLEKRLCRRDYTFDYGKQPSGAMHKYRQAFLRNDGERYGAFLNAVLSGEKKMHAGTLYPYQIVQACIEAAGDARQEKKFSEEMLRSLDAAWRSLPDYCDSRNALAVIDGSGSMYWNERLKPAAVAMSLGIYFAEHNTGYFRDHFITFSRTPRLVKLEGDNIADRTAFCMSFNECENTNLRAVFGLLLDTAVRNSLPQEELPEVLYIISDMEFDIGVSADRTLYEDVRSMYAAHGYRLPSLVYWNVESRHEQYPVKKDEHGTVLVSGASPSVFRAVISQDTTPEGYMLSVLNSGRYAQITG